MKWREADQITRFIFTDDIHGENGEYDFEEDGRFFVIEFNYSNKMVFVYAKAGEVLSRPWLGTKDSMTTKFREWLYKTINDEVQKKVN